MAKRKIKSYDPKRFDEEYFERGLMAGISGYRDYQWMSEPTLKMAHFLITQLPIRPGEKVIDYGCAKGYLVKALRILEVDAFGVDISEYAIDQVPPEIRPYCRLIKGADDPKLFDTPYEWLLSKDVFEHMPEKVLGDLLTQAKTHANQIFTVIPLGRDNTSNRFVIPQYDEDVTHITIRTKSWWMDFFEELGWNTTVFRYSLRGVKDKWTEAYNKGNGFFQLEKD